MTIVGEGNMPLSDVMEMALKIKRGDVKDGFNKRTRGIKMKLVESLQKQIDKRQKQIDKRIDERRRLTLEIEDLSKELKEEKQKEVSSNSSHN